MRFSSSTGTRPTASASVATRAARRLSGSSAACAGVEAMSGTTASESAPKPRSRFLITPAFYRPAVPHGPLSAVPHPHECQRSPQERFAEAPVSGLSPAARGERLRGAAPAVESRTDTGVGCRLVEALTSLPCRRASGGCHLEAPSDTPDAWHHRVRGDGLCADLTIACRCLLAPLGGLRP